jgi:ABC-type branched-subunit amino acid transport system substrate-binding protein
MTEKLDTSLLQDFRAGRMSRRQFIYRASALGLSATFIGSVLAACGDETEPTASSTGGTPTGDPIKLGCPLPLTGWAAADGQSMQEGIEFAVDTINGSGGLLGRPIEMIIYDTEDMTPEKLNAAADKLVMQDKVSALVTGYGLTAVDPFVYGKYPVPYLAYDGSHEQIKTQSEHPDWNSHLFQLGDGEPPYGEGQFDFLAGLQYEYPNNRICLLAGDLGWDKYTLEALGEKAKANGWEVPMYEVFPYGTREWGAQLAKIRQIDPALICISDLDPADIKTFIDQFQAEPTNALVDAGYCASIKEFANIMGENGEGVTGYACAAILPTPEGEKFTADFTAKYGSPPGLSITATCYDGTLMWSEAVKKVGDPDDYAAVSDAIHTMNYQGLQGTYEFAEYNYVPLRQDTLPQPFFQVRDEELVRLFIGTEPAEAEWVAPPWIQA